MSLPAPNINSGSGHRQEGDGPVRLARLARLRPSGGRFRVRLPGVELLLIRHGQSANNALEHAAGDPGGRLPDPPLTPLGHRQARRLAGWAAQGGGGPVTHLYTSLTTRAAQTAAPLAAALGLPVQGLAAAYECGGLSTGPAGGFAPVTGRDHASLRLDCPPLVWPDDLVGRPWDGGHEPWEPARFQARAAHVAAALRGVMGAQVVALVTHHDFAGYLLAELLGLPSPGDGGPVLRLDNTGTARLTPTPGRAALDWLNRADHLPPALRSR